MSAQLLLMSYSHFPTQRVYMGQLSVTSEILPLCHTKNIYTQRCLRPNYILRNETPKAAP